MSLFGLQLDYSTAFLLGRSLQPLAHVQPPLRGLSFLCISGQLHRWHSVWCAALRFLTGQDPERSRPFLALPQTHCPSPGCGPACLPPPAQSLLPHIQLSISLAPNAHPRSNCQWALADSPCHCRHNGNGHASHSPGVQNSLGLLRPPSSPCMWPPSTLFPGPSGQDRASLSFPWHAGPASCSALFSMADWARLGRATAKTPEKVAQDMLYFVEGFLPLWRPGQVGRQDSWSCECTREVTD